MPMRDVIPGDLRDRLPAKLQDAQIVGVSTAACDEDVRLYGPPGTGKTTQASLRTAVRAETGGLEAWDVTVVTYRAALADSMWGNMLDWGVYSEIVDEDQEEPYHPADDRSPRHYWGTVHAVAARATNFHDRFSSDADDDLAGMMDENAAKTFCRELGISHKPSKPWFETPWTAFARLYSYARQNLLGIGGWPSGIPESTITPLTADARARRLLDTFGEQWGRSRNKTDPARRFKTVVARYEQWKQANNVADYWEMLAKALADNASLPPMEHLVIDEYHDVYPLMALLTEKWAAAAETVIIAGDPDQTVNAYSGADPRFFERVNERVGKDIPTVLLKQSHRVPDEHFAAAAQMLSKARDVPPVTPDGPGDINQYRPTPITEENGTWSLPHPEEPGSPVHLYNEYGSGDGGLMYLARTKRQLDGVGAGLDYVGATYESQDGVAGDWGTRKRVLAALSELQHLQSKREEQQLSVAGSLSPDTVQTLVKHSQNEYIDEPAEIQELVNKAREGERSARRDLSPNVDAGELGRYIDSAWWPTYGQGIQSLPELVGLTDLDKVAMRRAVERYGTMNVPIEDVRLLTIHASKGSEASEIVLYDGITGRTKRSIEQHRAAAENEARTWYVALTRSSNRLHIVRGPSDDGDDEPGTGHGWTYPHLPANLEETAAAAAKRAAADDNEVTQ
jgi:DNA helicase-2/ATP-dependent DNA helicase PcrA